MIEKKEQSPIRDQKKKLRKIRRGKISSLLSRAKMQQQKQMTIYSLYCNTGAAQSIRHTH